METKHCSPTFYRVLTFLVVSICISRCIGEDDKKVYIVYMGSLPDGEDDYSPVSHHLSILEDVLKESSARDSLVRSYNRSFNGFVAKLSDKEREIIAAKEEVLSVFPSTKLQMKTTRSWDFLGFPENAKRNPTVESDVIIGMIDSGITPDSESFRDKGFGPPPKKWKGSCHNFTCNNKIIGARSYSFPNATDEIGHGTHTSSTAAGNKVSDVSFYELAKGLARGGVPSARLAMYKACGIEGCASQDVLSAFDDAIADGVDIISISLGGDPMEFSSDIIAIGSFHAMEKNVLTVHSAGNEGPDYSSTGSNAPWLFSVAATSTDRKFLDQVVLGNGQTINGTSVNAFNETKLPLIFGADASTTCPLGQAGDCIFSCLDSELVKNKIVICRTVGGKGEAVRAGAGGVIVATDSLKDFASVDPLPTSQLTSAELSHVFTYLNSTKNPQASLCKSLTIGNKYAPIVASFSSRGPNPIVSDILKPDISAPGIDILAAYPPLVSPSDNTFDKRSVKYNILSGTSMSCPHVAGAAAYVKSFHPDWSASAIKSSLMTTASHVNIKSDIDDQFPEGEFAYGAGHLNPIRAVDPGLLYETFSDDYQRMLCSIGSPITGKCPKVIKGSPKDLNYPSIQSEVKVSKPFIVKFPRTVKNVGIANSTYQARVISDPKINVHVEPNVLVFEALDEEKSFVVTVSGGGIDPVTRLSAALVWSDGIHSVRSPIVVYVNSE